MRGHPLKGVLASIGVDGMGVKLLPESVDVSRNVRARGVEGPGHVLGGVEGLPGCDVLLLLCFGCLCHSEAR